MASASRPSGAEIAREAPSLLPPSVHPARRRGSSARGRSVPSSISPASLHPFTAGAERGDERGTLFANLAGGWQVLPWLQPELELNYAHDYEASATPEGDLLCATGGVVAPFADGDRITAGIQYAAWGRHTGQFVGGAVVVKAAF